MYLSQHDPTAEELVKIRVEISRLTGLPIPATAMPLYPPLAPKHRNREDVWALVQEDDKLVTDLIAVIDNTQPQYIHDYCCVASPHFAARLRRINTSKLFTDPLSGLTLNERLYQDYIAMGDYIVMLGLPYSATRETHAKAFTAMVAWHHKRVKEKAQTRRRRRELPKKKPPELSWVGRHQQLETDYSAAVARHTTLNVFS